MADAIVDILIKELALVVKKELEQEVRLVVGVKTEVRKLQQTFETIQAVLNEAEQRQMDDASVKIWLDNLKSAAYQMEDVLDEWATKIELLQLEKRNPHEVSSSYSCSPFFTPFKQTALRHKIGSRIKAIRETLDSIREDKDKFQFRPSEGVRNGPRTIRTETSYIIVDPDNCGRDYDKNIILNKILGIGSSTTSHQIDETSDPRIISIIGMGGLGKTTLAQLVFNHHSIKTNFEIPMWVCVSDPFDRVMVAKAIIREATKRDAHTSTWNALHEELCESVRGKKFFLVLDDVWTEDPNNLNPLKHLLVLGAEGSRILVTTRNESVASRINSSKHELKILSPEDSKLLLCRKAFHGNESKRNPVLNKISFDISCRGLPLVLSLLGSLLNKRIDEESWRHILNSKLWELKGFDDEKLLYPAFLVSYDGLSSNLKNCFAHCAIFQKDEILKKRKLIRLWMAQGFLNSKDPELLGEEYFDELAAGSFFQDFSVDHKGNICFKMHDLIHDFAQFLTNPSYISLYNGKGFHLNQENNSKPILLDLIYDERDSISPAFFRKSIEKVCNVRTLQTVLGERCQDLSLEIIGSLSSDLVHLKCLRVLKLKQMCITQLPDKIDKLIHLRYLDLSYNFNLKELPKSIGRLINLQTLKLRDCHGLHQLPGDMGGMIHLRKLDIRGCFQLNYLPKGIGNWRSLRTLSTFTVSGGTKGCKLEVLKYHNLLKGRLEIRGLQRLNATEEAAEAQLHLKSQLSELLLDFDSISAKWDDVLEKNSVLAENVLCVLRPHSNLKNLTISEYIGLNFPSWMGNTEALTHLRRLELNRCIKCSELPALGLLPSLEELRISGLYNLKSFGVETFGGGQCITHVAFPKLTSLLIQFASRLEVWEFGNEQVQVASIMPCLTSIHLERCNALIALPVIGTLPSLQKLNSLRLDDLKNLEVINLGEMPCLQRLHIQMCSKLKSLRFRTKSLPSLEILYFSTVRILEEFKVEEEEEEENSTGKLPRLSDIHFDRCNNLKSFPRHLPSLRNLDTDSFPSLMSGPHLYLQIPPNLKVLHINHDHSQLDVGKIAEYFKELQQLNIIGISNKRDKGEDWSMLSYIPDITINYEKIDPSTYSSSPNGRNQISDGS
ncbi:hypothetical protein MKW92_037844 [Papaver armeniacum]|nr:hypothetical protein MKW92_037844 [Papaver armeniacum]